MRATVKFARNFDSLETLELLTGEDMREVGLLVRELIVTRTRFQQLDVNGQPFQSLSPKYADYKHKSLGGIPKPDLTVSGNMLNDITVVEALGWHDEGGPSVSLGFTK